MRGGTPPFERRTRNCGRRPTFFRGGYGLTVHAVSPWPRIPRSAPWATARHRAARRSPQRNAPSRTTSSAHEHLWSISEHLPTGVRDARPARAAAPRKRRPHDDRGAGPVRRAAGRAGAFGFAGALTARIERENAPGGAAVSVAEGTGTDALLHGQAVCQCAEQHASRTGPGRRRRIAGAGRWRRPQPAALHGGCAGIRAPAAAVWMAGTGIARTAMRGRMPPFERRTKIVGGGPHFSRRRIRLMVHAVSPWPRMTRSASQGRAVRTHRAPATEQHGRVRTPSGPGSTRCGTCPRQRPNGPTTSSCPTRCTWSRSRCSGSAAWTPPSTPATWSSGSRPR